MAGIAHFQTVEVSRIYEKAELRFRFFIYKNVAIGPWMSFGISY